MKVIKKQILYIAFTIFLIFLSVQEVRAENYTGDLQTDIENMKGNGTFVKVEESGTYLKEDAVNKAETESNILPDEEQILSSVGAVTADPNGNCIIIENNAFKELNKEACETYKKLTCDGYPNSCVIKISDTAEKTTVSYEMLRYNDINQEDGVITYETDDNSFLYSITIPQRDLTGIVDTDWSFDTKLLIQKNDAVKESISYQLSFMQNSDIPFPITCMVNIKDMEQFYLYQEKGDNIYEKINTDISKDGYLTFTTSQLTRYVLYDKPIEEIRKEADVIKSSLQSSIDEEKLIHEDTLKSYETILEKDKIDEIEQHKNENKKMITLIIAFFVFITAIITVKQLTNHSEKEKK